MRFVKIEQTSTGYLLNPNAYLDWLDEASALLPAGARTFAIDPGHYDIHSGRCVKDLKLDHISLLDRQDRVTLEILLAPNEFKHECGLLIRYSDVTSFSVDVTAEPRTHHVWPDTRRLGDLQLDEILPHEKGCSHEIKMIGGTVRVVSSDLVAEWSQTVAEVDGSPEVDHHHA